MVKERKIVDDPEEDSEKSFAVNAGFCKIVFEKDEKGRVVVTPECPPDKNGKPKISKEAKAFSRMLQEMEIVLGPPKLKKDEDDDE